MVSPKCFELPRRESRSQDVVDATGAAAEDSDGDENMPDVAGAAAEDSDGDDLLLLMK